MVELVEKREFKHVTMFVLKHDENDLKSFEAEARRRVEDLKKICGSYDGENPYWNDVYIGTLQDFKVGEAVSRFLGALLGMPKLDLSPVEEEAYGLPRFSAYYNEDARSWCGKWMYSEADVSDKLDELLFAFREGYKDLKEIRGEIKAYLEKPGHVVAVLLNSALDP